MENRNKCIYCINRFYVPDYLKDEYSKLNINPGLACFAKRINIEGNNCCEQFEEEKIEVSTHQLEFQDKIADDTTQRSIDQPERPLP